MTANRSSFRLSLIALTLGGLAALPVTAHSQDKSPAGFPIDWSHSHVAYRQGASLKEVKKIESDPRYLLHQYMQQQAERRGLSAKKGNSKNPLTIDWAVSLGNGAVAQNMFPAKFDFATTNTASCSDWVVFGLNVTGDTTAAGGKQANLIAFNNLYGTAGSCAATPAVLFSYADTSGPITTSPVISYLDNGAQVAFVANEGGKATLRVIKYKSGDGTAAAAPVALPGTGSQVSFQYSSTTNTNSPLYIDYFNDAAYVGDDGGFLYKISPVFGGGTPAQVWKATLAGKLTGPVLDQANNVVLVGSSNGDLYSRKAADGTQAAAALIVGDGSTSGGIVDPPVIVEEGIGVTTYAFATTGCDSTSSNNGLLYEASETATTLVKLATENIGTASTIAGTCATNNLHSPTLDDAAYNGTAGNDYVCGTQSSFFSGSGKVAPELYSFSFPSGGGAIGSGSSTTPSSMNSSDECSPITYFTSNSTSKIFMGMGYSSQGTVNSYTVSGTGGFSAATSVTTPNGLGGTSGIIVDNTSATAGLANVYFSGLTAGNVSATSGSCKSFSVTAKSSGTTVTLTGTGFNFTVGSTIVVSGFSGTIPATYNGTWVVGSVSGTTSLTYTDTSASTDNTSSNGTASWGVCGFQLSQSGLS